MLTRYESDERSSPDYVPPINVLLGQGERVIFLGEEAYGNVATIESVQVR